MELDELRQRWAAQDRRLDEVLRLNRRRLRTLDLDKTKSAMQRVRAMIAIRLVIDGVAVVAMGAFIAAHLSEFRFLVPALSLHLVVLGVLISTIREWVMASAIDYDAPVIEIQRRLESLRVARIRTTQAVMLLAPLLWTPLLIVGLRVLPGLDAYALLGAKYLLANLLFGLAFIPAMVWACRRFADRLDRAPWVRSLARDVAGPSLTAALDQLARISAFEHEERGT
ncbi:hypothetical protein [Hyalangium rubrum]|uniref:Uncharacterized protein n=1 Tax=Hyalangium rubrum TaxID=3103134 RepID=A0ABU5HI19_9BACT|nr:hypothetical protein [Hyalangium sp. s54d21]MDY7232891.1 hypothetical protein [Hyalangium sp. s54d21]